MASIFSRFRKKLPAVSTKGSAYYNRENLIHNTDDLVRILQGAPHIKGFSTSLELTFNKMSLLEITPALLRRSFDSPAHVLDRSAFIPGHKIIFYKDSVAHYKFLIQYHFFSDQFFFASNKISSMNLLSEKDKHKIINRISKKYLKKDAEPDASPVIKVTDSHGSIIHTVDDVYFHVHYLPANDIRKQLTDTYAGQVKPPLKPEDFRESLEKYI